MLDIGMAALSARRYASSASFWASKAASSRPSSPSMVSARSLSSSSGPATAQTISAALTGITAAVVGVIADLALYFAVHTLFTTTQPWRWGPLRLEVPELASLRPVPLVIAAAALVMIFRLRWSVPRTLLACAGLGLAASLIGLPVS